MVIVEAVDCLPGSIWCKSDRWCNCSDHRRENFIAKIVVLRQLVRPWGRDEDWFEGKCSIAKVNISTSNMKQTCNNERKRKELSHSAYSHSATRGLKRNKRGSAAAFERRSIPEGTLWCAQTRGKEWNAVSLGKVWGVSLQELWKYLSILLLAFASSAVNVAQ